MARTVDIDAYLPVLVELTRQGHEVSLTVTGGSMTPFLAHGRDQVCFRRPGGPLKRGDIAFFRRTTGAYILHRICRVDRQGNYYFVGDGQQEVEGPIAPEQVFGVVTRVCRKGRWLGPGDFRWAFFAGPWLWLRPVRPWVLRLYGGVSRLWKGDRHGKA